MAATMLELKYEVIDRYRPVPIRLDSSNERDLRPQHNNRYNNKTSNNKLIKTKVVREVRETLVEKLPWNNNNNNRHPSTPRVP
jgi:hypothetical protein